MWDEDQGGGRHRERDADTYEAEPMRKDMSEEKHEDEENEND